MTRRLGTVAEAAAEYHVSVTSIRRWIADGTIRAERVGKRRFAVDLDSLARSAVTVPDPRRESLVVVFEALTPERLKVLAEMAQVVAGAFPERVDFEGAWSAIAAIARRSPAQSAERSPNVA